MKHLKQFLSDARRHQGLALIIVLSMLALATIVILAFLSVADTEHKATITFSSSQSARRISDTAVNIVMAQIRSGAAREPEPGPGENVYSNIPVIHATQPGAIRKYNRAGVFMAGYKLFSDADLIYRAAGPIEGWRAEEQRFVQQSEPPADWNTGNNLSRYVDLNEPVVKGVANADGNIAGVETVFPVIDPRAGMDMDPGEGDIPVEGFSYSGLTAIGKVNLGDKVKLPPGATTGGAVGGAVAAEDIDGLRLPMPVQWLYVLKDGTVGHLDAGLQFISAAGAPTAANPIVGRVAFWTDDETCKVNINTASEPTFMGQPIYYHERDHRWADFPPSRSEYQRFSGHPATVALSSVLYPNPYQAAARSMETYRKSAGDLKRIVDVKEKIYDLMPRIHTNGSKAGTLFFDKDDFGSSEDSAKATAVAIQDALTERLYASVDELLFSQKTSDETDTRIQNNANMGTAGLLFTKNTLERASAFLTASSRGSEVSMFGLPKIAMWPIAENADYRTGYDNLIDFCSRLGPNNTYVFQRGIARNANHDIMEIPRNLALMNMLDQIMKGSFPSASVKGGTNAGKFSDKMGEDNQRQLLAQMFDYIRCTNLYDSHKAPERGEWKTASNSDWVLHYRIRDELDGEGYETFTPGFIKHPFDTNTQTDNKFNDRSLPGHGQVTPAEWRIGGKTYRGFGRSVSVSEIGLHFICTADGQPDMYSWRGLERDETPPEPGDESMRFKIPVVDFENPQTLNDLAQANIITGGRTALKLDRGIDNDAKLVYVNPKGFEGDVHRIINAEAVHWGGGPPNKYTIRDRYYSNYPPLTEPHLGIYYKTVGGNAEDATYHKYFKYHPGYDWKNWNWTLEYNKPLLYNEKRIQAMLHFEFFCPSVGYPEINPEFTLVLDGDQLGNITVKTDVGDLPLFSTTGDIVIRSGQPLYNPDDTPEIGGFASFRKLSAGRFTPQRGNMPEDIGYNNGSSSDPHGNITSMDLVSNFITVNSGKPLEFLSSKPLLVKIYDTHDYKKRDPIQTIEFDLVGGKCPTPELVVLPTHNVLRTNSDGSQNNVPAVQAPHWWTFNRGGALGRVTIGNNEGDQGSNTLVDDKTVPQFWDRGRLMPVGSGLPVNERGLSGHNGLSAAATSGGALGFFQRVPGPAALFYAYENNDNYRDVRSPTLAELEDDKPKRIRYSTPDYILPEKFGSDVVRTLQPITGDPRIIYAKKNVPKEDWTKHYLWDREHIYMAHNFSSYTSGGEPGFDRYGEDTPPPTLEAKAAKRILPHRILNINNNAELGTGYWPDAPARVEAVNAAQRYFDFDDSDPGGRIGPFINKPDEGNFAVGEYKPSNWPEAKRWRASYFRTGIGARTSAAGENFFTPNRMISSPVMMGSLMPAIYGSSGGNIGAPNDGGAWQSLLFRPHVAYTNPANFSQTHPGAANPPDHYLLDMFWMPVVEPYAISEALSTAGKINMNYQMVPFTHIRRATAMHAVMKGELFAALPDSDYEASKTIKLGFGTGGSSAPVFRSEESGPSPNGGVTVESSRYWHRSIVIDRMVANGAVDTPWWQQAINDRVQGTLRQFEERFNFDAAMVEAGNRGGLFRSPSQICEIHLVPSQVPLPADWNVAPSQASTYTERESSMARFWQNHCTTGDNTRERPYSNLYAKLTTRSNTFRVHVRSQTIRKATRSVDADTFDPARDEVTAEYRGSFLLERYIDPRDAGNPLPDYAAAADPFALAPLESFYRFRILESKRFAP